MPASDLAPSFEVDPHPLSDMQDFAGYVDPRTTCRYDRARYSLDRNANFAISASQGALRAQS